MSFPKKLRVAVDALCFGWRQKTFRLWLGICTTGIVAGILLGIGMTQLVLLVAIACIGWGLEIANSAIENLCDLVCPGQNGKVKVIKDAFASVPIFVFSAYIISWLILVSPSLVRWMA